jgi:hypothetical protein
MLRSRVEDHPTRSGIAEPGVQADLQRGPLDAAFGIGQEPLPPEFVSVARCLTATSER